MYTLHVNFLLTINPKIYKRNHKIQIIYIPSYTIYNTHPNKRMSAKLSNNTVKK